jgi:hypothetical protein
MAYENYINEFATKGGSQVHNSDIKLPRLQA